MVDIMQEIENMARTTQVRLLEAQMTPPPPELCSEFALESNDNALKIIRVRSSHGEPFGYYESWTVGLEKMPERAELVSAPRLEIFRLQGLKFTHLKQAITIESATEEIANTLDLSAGAPLLSMIRRSYDSNENLLDILHARYHPDRFQYKMDLILEEEG